MGTTMYQQFQHIGIIETLPLKITKKIEIGDENRMPLMIEEVESQD